MPIHVTRTVTGPDGTDRLLADRDTLAKLIGFGAYTIRAYCQPTLYDETTGRALYDQHEVEATLTARGCKPRPHFQGPGSRAGRVGPAKRRRKPGSPEP